MNPFRAARIRPGTLAYFFTDPTVEAQFWQQVDATGWGQIVGPHGTGKSTLCCELVQRCHNQGRTVRHLRLTSQTPNLHSRLSGLRCEGLGECLACAAGWYGMETQTVIDGFEQLSPVWRWLVVSLVRFRHGRLIVTSHADCGMRTLLRTNCDLRHARYVVDRLLSLPRHGEFVSGDVVSDQSLMQLLDTHGGNLREVLFDLYDFLAVRA